MRDMLSIQHHPHSGLAAVRRPQVQCSHVISAVMAAPRRQSDRTAAPEAPLEALSASDMLMPRVRERGFLPPMNDPVTRLPSTFELWERALDELPKRVVAAEAGSLKHWLAQLPEFPADLLLEQADSEDAIWRGMLLLSFLSHGYLWKDDGETPDALPANLARPWAALAQHLGVPPILNYSTYILHNWRRLDATRPVQLGNIVCCNNFLGGLDEEWFRLVHVDIEISAGPALASILPAQAAAAVGDREGVQQALETIAQGLQAMVAALERMHDKCDPHIYYERVRLPTSGWRGNPALPNGLLYEGVWDEPQHFYGASGAQSSILPALDAALGVQHPEGWLKQYLATMRLHMPRQHRAFIDAIEAQAPLRKFVQQDKGLLPLYDECIQRLTKFRTAHRGFARSYIQQQSAKGGEVRGTGGTTFMPALQSLRNATQQHALKPLEEVGAAHQPIGTD